MNKEQIESFLRGLAVSTLGAIGGYATEYLATHQMGSGTFLAWIASNVVNAIRLKWFAS